MVINIEVKTALGVFELTKPKAGVRNRAVSVAETETGQLKFSTMMMTLLPNCVSKRPVGIDQDVPIDQILDGLEIEDYDLLVEELSKLLKVRANAKDNVEVDVKKEENEKKT